MLRKLICHCSWSSCNFTPKNYTCCCSWSSCNWTPEKLDVHLLLIFLQLDSRKTGPASQTHMPLLLIFLQFDSRKTRRAAALDHHAIGLQKNYTCCCSWSSCNWTPEKLDVHLLLIFLQFHTRKTRLPSQTHMPLLWIFLQLDTEI